MNIRNKKVYLAAIIALCVIVFFIVLDNTVEEAYTKLLIQILILIAAGGTYYFAIYSKPADSHPIDDKDDYLETDDIDEPVDEDYLETNIPNQSNQNNDKYIKQIADDIHVIKNIVAAFAVLLAISIALVIIGFMSIIG